MRLLTLKLHRAFPELDRFDDRSAAAFVLAASRMSAASTALTAVACVMTFLVVTVLGIVACVALFDVVDPRRQAVISVIASLVLPVFSGGVSAFIVRDLFLRSRISSLLLDQGRCRACRYELLGLPRDGMGSVRCPECGTPNAMDESFDRLTDAHVGAVSRESFVHPVTPHAPPDASEGQRGT